MASTTLQYHGGSIEAEMPPIRVDEDGVLRVGDSRILVVLVISEFNRGSSPEEIREAYPTAALVDIYGVIAYYLRHQEELDQYIADYERQGERLRQIVESRQGQSLDEMRRRMADKKSTMRSE